MDFKERKVDEYLEKFKKDNYILKEEEERYIKNKLTKREEAMIKFGFILLNYEEREALKYLYYDLDDEHKNSKIFDDLKILAHWSRSLEASNYNLMHPSFYEYRQHYNTNDVPWLRNGYSYVDIKSYQKWKQKK